MTEVDIDFGAKTALITMAPGTSLSRDQCDAVFQETRYEVLEFRTLGAT